MYTSPNVQIPAGRCSVAGDLRIPAEARAIVVLVHGSGVTRHDHGNSAVAMRLEHARFSTLRVDLLQEHETHDRHNVFDVGMQADRLLAVMRWLRNGRRLRSLPLGLYGTGIGSGVALTAADKAPQAVSALVLRGGRPDSALYDVSQVRAPMLFIDDEPDAGWVDMAYRKARAEKQLVQVRSASHIYSEPKAIEAVAEHAERWFSRYLERTPRQVEA